MSSPRNRRASMARPARAARLRNPGRGSSRPRSHVGASAPRGTRPRSSQPQDVDAPHGAHAARPRRRRRPDGIEARAIGRARSVPRERVNGERRRCVHAARDERLARRGTTVRPSVVRGEDGRCGRRDRRRSPLSSSSAVRVRWERERGALSLASRRSAVSNLIGQRSRSRRSRSSGSCGGARCAWGGGRSSRVVPWALIARGVVGDRRATRAAGAPRVRRGGCSGRVAVTRCLGRRRALSVSVGSVTEARSPAGVEERRCSELDWAQISVAKTPFARVGRWALVAPGAVGARCASSRRDSRSLSSASAFRVCSARDRSAAPLASRSSAVPNLIGQRYQSRRSRSSGSCGGRSLRVVWWALVARRGAVTRGRCGRRALAARRVAVTWCRCHRRALSVSVGRATEARSRWRRGAALSRT